MYRDLTSSYILGTEMMLLVPGQVKCICAIDPTDAQLDRCRILMLSYFQMPNRAYSVLTKQGHKSHDKEVVYLNNGIHDL